MHESEWIRKRAAQNILNACNFAQWRGQDLNVFVVLMLKDTISQSSNTAFRRLMQKYRVWLAYKRLRSESDVIPAYIYSHENPRDNPHVNCLFHVPENLIEEFKVKIVRWIHDVQGAPDEQTLYLKTIENGSVLNIVRHLIKGVDPEHIDRFGLRRLCDAKGPQGTVHGQRAGFSRSLGPTAIKTAGFNAMKYYRTKIKKHDEPE